MMDRIEKQVVLRAPVDRVWRAITDAEQFGQWFRVRLDGPFQLNAPSSGQLTVPGYEYMRWEAQVVALEPQSLFAFEWHPHAVDPSADYSAEPLTRVEFRLEALSDGTTRLTITESGFEALPPHRRDTAFPRNADGWAAQMGNLQAYVER